MSNVEEFVIIGAGDHGRSALEILLASETADGPAIAGFLDDDRSKHGSTIAGLPILGGLDWVREHARGHHRFIVAMAKCHVKRAIAEQLAEFGVRFGSAVHPRAFIGRGVVVGAGSIVNAGAAVAYDTVIGEHTTINLNATVGHDCAIGAYSTVAPGANIAGRVVIGEGCDIGLNAAIGKGLAVGEWAVVGPGAVIIRDVEPGARMFGNPARAVPEHRRTQPAAVGY